MCVNIYIYVCMYVCMYVLLVIIHSIHIGVPGQNVVVVVVTVVVHVFFFFSAGGVRPGCQFGHFVQDFDDLVQISTRQTQQEQKSPNWRYFWLCHIHFFHGFLSEDPTCCLLDLSCWCQRRINKAEATPNTSA